MLRNVCIILVTLFVGCKVDDQRGLELISKLEEDEQGNVLNEIRMTVDSVVLYMVYYDLEGNVESISVASNGEFTNEALWFHDNGRLSTKNQVLNGKIHGLAYYFYESGVIEAKRNWQNDLKVGLANDYFDTTGNVKSVLLYNDSGQLYYRKTFDQQGYLVSVEGEK